MRIERLVLGLASSTLALFAVACSQGAADDSGQDEGATVIEPDGTDNPGKLMVSTPNGAADPTTFKLDNAPTARPLGQLVDGLKVGAHTVTLETRGTNYTVTTAASIAVAAGQTAVVTPGLVRVDARTTARTFGLGKDATDSQIQVLNGTNLGTVAPTSDGSSAMAVIGSGFEVNFGISNIDGIAVAPQAGNTQQITLSGNAGRRISRIQAPASRDMPPANCGWQKDVYMVSINASGGQRSVTLAPGETIDFGTSPRFDNYHYYLQANAWQSSVDIPIGQRGAGPELTKLGRIDVDDVLINSTQPRVKGTYQIYRANPDGSAKGGGLLSCSPSTKTGVDLLPGKYRVEVSYSTIEAGLKTDVHVVDVN